MFPSRDSAAQSGEWVRRDYVPPATLRANRRRLGVFLGTLIVALVVGLAVTWLRPAEYRASARLTIMPAGAPAPGTASATVPVVDGAQAFLTEVQVLTSRPVLEAAAARVETAGHPLASGAGDPIADLQSRLEAIHVPNTNVVELVAKGTQPETLAALVNTIIDVYRARLADMYRESSAESMAQAGEEVRRLGESIAAKRREVEAFRQRHKIVSLERDENQMLSQLRSMSATLTSANERVAKAEGKLRALTDAAASGTATAKDDPAVGALEQRAAAMREELKSLERDFTPNYLARDPRVTALRERLAEVERAIVTQRQTGERNAIAAAQEELASARNAAAQIDGQIAAARTDASQFNARFNEYKSKQDQLAALETTLQDASKRQARLDATEGSRTPTVNLLEAAATPQQPWRPLYWRDTVIAVVASLALALLAMWLVELFNRAEPQPTLVVVQPQPGGLPPAPPIQAPRWQGSAALPQDVAPPLLAQPAALPRELTSVEAEALIAAADDTSRAAVLLLFCGLSLDEALALEHSDVDVAGNRLHVRGGSARELTLRAPLRTALAAPSAKTQELVLGTSQRPATADTVGAEIVSAAHDAAIDGAIEVTPACLRHTYIAYLVRQGMRFADLQRFVGHLSAPELGAYSALSPRGARTPVEAIDTVFPPALREAPRS